MIRLCNTPFDPAAELTAFTLRAEGAGAIVSFTGLVRPVANTEQVTCLHLQAYSPMTERGIESAVTEATTRWSLKAASVVHRIGDMASGEPIVFVATASAHRRAAFEAADFLMDYLKTDAIFWKKEIRSGGNVWIEPRAEDYSDRARWTRQDG